MFTPTIKWAQRKQTLFLIVPLSDIEHEKVTLNPTTLHLECQSHGKHYAVNLEFYSEIDTQHSKWSKTGFHLSFILAKAKKQEKYWPRLTKENVKLQYVQCDWEKWIDEDEEEEEGNKGLGGMDLDGMNNFNDSDDEEELPKEKAESQSS